MRRFIIFPILFALVALGAPLLILAAKVGQPAPDFTGTASNNQTYHLADYHGKFVVLEWHNNGCPYTRKHYMSGNMQKLQKQWTAQGIICVHDYLFRWHAGIRGCKRGERLHGKNGNGDATQPTYLMVIIAHSLTPKQYPPDAIKALPSTMERIDNRPTDDVKDIVGATNYVNIALGQALAGRPVETAATRPYGCSVKYKGSWF